MIGQLVWTGERYLGVRLSRELVRGIPVLRVELPGKPEDRGADRRKVRAFRLLEREGCRRLLEDEGRSELPVVVTRPLWQAVAAPLTLSFFHRCGQRPELARVELESDRVTRPLFAACCQLLPAVRGISLRCPDSEELSWWLERRYGVPVSSRGGDVTVRFLPGEGKRGACLPLGEAAPELPGFTLDLKDGDLPEVYPRLPLMTVLLEQGRLSPEDVDVVWET